MNDEERSTAIRKMLDTEGALAASTALSDAKRSREEWAAVEITVAVATERLANQYFAQLYDMAGRVLDLEAERDDAHRAMFSAVSDLAKATERLRDIESAARKHYDAADDCICPVCSGIVFDLVKTMELVDGEVTRTRKATT